MPAVLAVLGVVAFVVVVFGGAALVAFLTRNWSKQQHHWLVASVFLTAVVSSLIFFAFVDWPPRNWGALPLLLAMPVTVHEGFVDHFQRRWANLEE